LLEFKTFELSVVEGGLYFGWFKIVLVYPVWWLLGKESAAQLYSTVEDLVQKAEVKEFFKSTREASEVL
jgi:hypothetical protein